MNQSHKTAENRADVQNEIDGFNSLVTLEEKEALADVKKAVDRYEKIHSKCALDVAKRVAHRHGINAMQRVHYLVFCDLSNDLLKAAHCLSTIDTDGVKALAESHIESGDTYEHMEKTFMLNKLFSRK